MIYSEHVYVEEIQDKNRDKDLLISGAFSAKNSIMQEALSRDARLRNINVKGFHIIINDLPGNTGTILIITSSETIFLTHIVNRFISNFPEKITKKLEFPNLNM